jgi:hypothetical protein
MVSERAPYASAPAAERGAGAPPGPRELIDACSWVWDTHNSAALSLDAHIEACLAGRNGAAAAAAAAAASARSTPSRAAEAGAASFVSEVVYGLHRYSAFLSSFLDGFFFRNRWPAPGLLHRRSMVAPAGPHMRACCRAG